MPREASGTAWNPDSSPVRGIHIQAGGWMLMLHGNLAAGLDVQGTERGDTALVSTNWLMAMASHTLGVGQVSFRAMLSLEPVTVGAQGYPLLLQTGETYQGEPLVDRQHPHDLFMELAARYIRPVAGGVWLELYGGPAGEPALGPVAYPHRISAMADPLAPLGHHWIDATHITFGVATVGLFNRWVKLEGSWFNGREPDEARYDLEFRPFDSYSGRLSVNPMPNWSVQVSHGFLATPEAIEPDQSVRRTTASVAYHRPLGPAASWATTLVWGRNTPVDHDPSSDALLLESLVETGAGGVLFLRMERVTKSAHDLDLALPGDPSFPIYGAVVGGLYELERFTPLQPGIGIRGNLAYLSGDILAERYGTRWPLGVFVYLNLRFGRMAVARTPHGIAH